MRGRGAQVASAQASAPTNYHEGRLRRGGGGQCVQRQGVSNIFVRMPQCCLAVRYVRNFLQEVVAKGVHLIVEAFVLSRSHALRPMPHMGARFGEAALASVHEGRAHFLVLGELCQVASKDYMFAFLLPEIVIEVAYMTVEAFCSRGLSVASIAESAKSSPNRRAFEAIMYCFTRSYSTKGLPSMVKVSIGRKANGAARIERHRRLFM